MAEKTTFYVLIAISVIRTFWATLTICRVSVWNFPVLFASLFIESLENLPELVLPTVVTQPQILPVQLQGGPSIFNTVMSFTLNVQI